MLAGLVLGLVAGISAGGLTEEVRQPLLDAARMVGGLWLNALKMTVVPLIVALLILGVAQGAEAMRAGRIAARAMGWFIGVYVGSAIFGAMAISALLRLLPLPQVSIDALRNGVAALQGKDAPATLPDVSDFFATIVPDNAFAAAANGDILQLVLFTLLFALAATYIGSEQRAALVSFFGAARDALLVLIGWVLWVAPLGVFALGFALASGAGAATVAALLHYVILTCLVGVGVGLAAYAVAAVFGRVGIGAFAKAMIGPQSIALSSRSSLASLPAMFAAARKLGVREKTAEITFPLIGALFRPTGPSMNMAVALYVAYWLGIEPGFIALAAGVAVASVISFGSVSIPGEVSFITTIGPIAIALGVPIAPLALLVAIEMIPDIVRTVGNVTMDVAVATAVDRGEETTA